VIARLSLAGANLVVAAIVLLPWLPAATPPAPAAALREGDAPRLQRLPRFADVSATIERPLFTPSRRPAAPEQAASVGIASRYRLQGLVIAGAARHAIVSPVAGGPALELGPGDAVAGWTVTRIEHDRVVLSSPAGEATLALERAAPAAPR
jgi:hypothetical protein